MSATKPAVMPPTFLFILLIAGVFLVIASGEGSLFEPIRSYVARDAEKRDIVYRNFGIATIRLFESKK